MNAIETEKVRCPYCGETIEVLIDCSVPQQTYIEDCQVCCRPIGFDVTVNSSGESQVLVSHEDE